MFAWMSQVFDMLRVVSVVGKRLAVDNYLGSLQVEIGPVVQVVDRVAVRLVAHPC